MKQNKSLKCFYILWIGQFIASIGSGLTAFALTAYIFETTGMASNVSLVVLLAFLPGVLLNPVAGVLADRFDRRLLMILGDGLSALGPLYILYTLLTGEITFLAICIGVVISSVFSSLLEPAYKATLTDILSEEQFAKASGLVQLASSSKFLLSPIIAGFLLTITGVETILIIDILTLVITVFAAFVVKRNIVTNKKARVKNTFLKDLSEGWKAITQNRGVFILIIVTSIITFYIGFIQTLSLPMVLSFSDKKTLGIMQSLGAIGMIISSIVIGTKGVTKKYTVQLSLGLGFAGVFIIFVGLTTNVVFLTVALFLFFACLPFMNTSIDVLIRTNIDNDKQGRAWGLIGILSQIGYIVAYATAGPLADRVFNPLLVINGTLAPTLGKIFGVGESRGIGLLLAVSGILIIVLAMIIPKIKTIRKLERY